MLPYLIVVMGISVVFSSILSLSFCVFFCRKGIKKKECEGVGAGVLGRPGVIQGD